jgi:polysaccharide export outer membrane protein
MQHLLLSLILVTLQAAAPQVPAAPVPAPQAPAQTTPVNNPSYVVGPTDVLSVKVFNEPDLSSNYTVDSDGSITYPLIGRVAVGGLTVRAVESHLTKLLTNGYVNRPQVSVEISQFRSRSIFVLGEVRAPGKYAIEDQVTLLEVIAKAGSLTSTAGNMIIVQRYKDGLAPVAMPDPANNNDVAEIMRVSFEALKEGRLQSNILLQDGDILFIPKAERFYVTGFVRTPGSFILEPGMTVNQAIAVAGGFTERGSTRGVKIIRKVNGKEVEVKVKLSDLVLPNDTIKVRQRLI